MRSAQVLASSLLAAIGSISGAQSEVDERAMREHVYMVAKIASGFVAFAGCEENAIALVESLREGVGVNLSYPGATPHDVPIVVPIEPPTGPMDWHDVRMALMLARDALTAYGVLRPSSDQLQAALLGGEVAVPGARTVAFRGVLHLRAEGRTWGQVASERYQRREVSRVE